MPRKIAIDLLCCRKASVERDWLGKVAAGPRAAGVVMLNPWDSVIRLAVAATFADGIAMTGIGSGLRLPLERGSALGSARSSSIDWRLGG